ncbi:putative TetR family transcriptional regulator [Pseudomonas syringae pv. helianthi]|nr:putative TetR family transcriptional regulator [Pseudomonas syringae pv. helianthi]
MAAAKAAAQVRGYSGINFCTIGEAVGIKNASIYYHFPSKAYLSAAVARRYWQDTAAVLEALRDPDPSLSLQHYPSIFRTSLEHANRICLASFMAAEYEDLPEELKIEVRAFADTNVTWLTNVLIDAGLGDPDSCERRARSI